MKIKDWQPKAYSIQNAGKCTSCKNYGLVSYLLDPYTKIRKSHGERYIDCGYFCESCGFSNAGGRLADPAEGV